MHRTVYQPFGNEVFEGIVKYVDIDTATSRTFWNVLYSDGNSGDLWDDEMIRWCIDQEAGSTPGHYVSKTSHPLTDTANTVDSSYCRPESFMNSDKIGGE